MWGLIGMLIMGFVLGTMYKIGKVAGLQEELLTKELLLADLEESLFIKDRQINGLRITIDSQSRLQGGKAV